MSQSLLFSSYPLGGLMLNNRIVMAPMTRSRATPGGDVPNAMMADYYRQRASAGLIITEGAPVSIRAHGYPFTPGLHTDEQTEAWKPITRAVHERKGRIFAQLWHCGRIGHHTVHADGGPPVGPGTLRADMKVTGIDPATGKAVQFPCDAPHALTTAETRAVVEEFARAARNALAAGFDGVEIHGANGYLLDQFRCSQLNDRQDEYGGALENRCRLTLQCVAAAAEVYGAGRVGLRISPLGTFNDMRPEPDPLATYGYLAQELGRMGIGYLHIYDQSGTWVHDAADPLLKHLRQAFTGTIMLCGAFDRLKAEAALEANLADVIAFGKPFISNPDLVERLAANVQLAPFDVKTFYAGGPRGYIDYPTAGSHLQGAPIA